MLLHYIKITFRSLVKDKSFAITNIIGLSIALTCGLSLLLWVKVEMSYDKYPKADRLYQLDVKSGENYTFMLGDLSGKLLKTFPQIENSVGFNCVYDPIEYDNNRVNVKIALSDVALLDMLDIPVVAGDLQNIKPEFSNCVISEVTSHKLFGSEDPIGKQIKSDGKDYTIGAVVALPEHTTFDFDFLLREPTGFYARQIILLKEGETLSPELLKQMQQMLPSVEEYPEYGVADKEIVPLSIKDIHLENKANTDVIYLNYYDNRGNFTLVVYAILAAIFILLMAIINYVNTSIARSMSSIRNIAVRKVSGARRMNLVTEFLLDAFVLTGTSLLIALAMIKLFYPFFSEMMGSKESLLLDWHSIGVIVVFILVCILSSSFTVFYVSSLRPYKILNGDLKLNTKSQLRKGLLGLQFFISLAIILCSTLFVRQLNFMLNHTDGMDRTNIIIVQEVGGMPEWVHNFRPAVLKENPNIIEISCAINPPYNAPWSYSGIYCEGEKIDNILFTQIFCDPNYANTFGLEIVEGQFFEKGRTRLDYDNETKGNVVVNEAFVKALNLEHPIGTYIEYALGEKGRIIGILKDFSFKPLNEKIQPLLMELNPFETLIYIKTNGVDNAKTLEYLRKKCTEFTSNPIEFRTVEQEYRKMYKAEFSTIRVLTLFSVIAIVLSIIGVVSLVAFMIEKRSKEIAIRKINGAKIGNIVILFLTDILKIAGVATILAIGASYYIMHSWLQNYVYRTSLSWWIFLLFPLALIVFISIVVVIQVLFTAKQRPIQSLRSE